MTEKEAFLPGPWGYVVFEEVLHGDPLPCANVEAGRHARASEPGLQGQ